MISVDDCEHEWEDFSGHDCSYVDCWCEHPCCIKCGVCIDDVELKGQDE